MDTKNESTADVIQPTKSKVIPSLKYLPDTFQSEKKSLQSYLHVLVSLRIEPVMFLFMFSFILNATCQTNMMMDKGCRFYFNYSEDICSNLKNHADEKNNVEILANNYNLYSNFLSPIGAAVVIFLAPWSDKYSRKIPLTFALFGFFLNDIGIILCTVYFDSGLEYILISNIPTQMTGGFICVMAMIYSHSSDVSSASSRSMKFTFLQISFGLAVTLGALAGAQIYRYYGYLAVFGTVALGHLLAIVWVVLLVPETAGSDGKTTCKEKFKNLFASQNFVGGFRTCLKPRKDNGRAKLWLLLASSCSVAITYKVYSDIAYLYTHQMYDWGPTKYSEMWTIFSFVEMVIFLLLTPLLIKVCKFSDSAIGVMGSVSIILKNVFLAVAFRLWLYYLSNILGSLNGLVNLAVRSLISQMVQEDEQGKVLSFLATCEAIAPLLGTSIVLKIFNDTVKIFPGTCYFAATVFLLLPLGTFVWLLARNRRISRDFPV